MEDAKIAFAVISCGGKNLKSLSFKELNKQLSYTSEFWVSFHELLLTHPWMSKRYYHLDCLFRGEEPVFPETNPFSYILALFVCNLTRVPVINIGIKIYTFVSLIFLFHGAGFA